MIEIFLKITLILPFISFMVPFIPLNNDNRWNDKIQLILMFMCFFLSVFFLIEITDSGSISMNIWTLSLFKGFTMNLAFYLDSVSGSFLFMTTGVFGFVFLYFMEKEKKSSKGYKAVFSLLFFFSQTAVLSSNLIVFICSWCGVGLCTYLLSIFSPVSKKTILIPERLLMNNVIGDCCLVLGCVGLIPFLGEASFDEIKQGNLPLLPSLFTLLGIFIKMGIIPFKSWAGELKKLSPSLFIIIGSGTTLSIGVLLLIRLSLVFDGNIKTVLCYSGLATAILGALMAMVKKSFKDILVFSSISHLGFMVLSCGIGFHGKTILYALSHGLGKTALLMAGSFLSSNHGGKDDIFQIGGSPRSLIFWGFLLSALPFSGIPGMLPLFFQYELAQIAYGTKQFFVFPILLAMALNTLCMTRLTGTVFFTGHRCEEIKSKKSFSSLFAFVGTVILSLMTGFGVLPGLYSWNGWWKFDLFVSNSLPEGTQIIQGDRSIWTTAMISFSIALCTAGFIHIFKKKESLSFRIKHSCLGIWSFIDQGFMFHRLFNLIFFKEIRWIWNVFLLFVETLIKAPIHILSVLIYQAGVFFNLRESKDMEGDALYIIIGLTIIITFVFSSFDI